MMANENPTPSAWLQQARDLIAQDRLDEAIALLRSLLDNSPRMDEVLHQSGRFTAIHKQIRTGTVSHDDATLTQNQIRAGLLALLREIETQQAESPILREEIAQAISVTSSKNVVVHSTITAGGDVHIGDKHVVQYAEKIYNIGHIGKADFGSLLNRSENDPAVISNNFYKINQAFIEQERTRSDDSCTPERFYVADPNAQWWGVFNDLVAPHSYYPGFKQEVEEGIYNSPYPVLAMLEGSGGMGKSTLARLLAAEMAIANQAEVWWLEAEGYGEEELREDWEEMLRTTGGTVTLVFVDDWGKFDAPARKFMQGVFRKAPERLRFVLTGRYQGDGGLEQKYLPAERRRIFDDNAELSQDNRQLLYKVQAAVQQGASWQSTLAALGDVAQSKPFQLLYVLFRLAEDPALKQAIKSTRATGIFRDILQYDLDRLRSGDKKGLGWALVFLAYCHSVLKTSLSKSSFLQLADHCSAPNSPLKWAVDLGDQPIKEWETLRHYCAETSSPANRRADAPRLIHLSKDDLAEEILNTPFEGYKTGRDFLTRHKKSLLTYLCEYASEYSASKMISTVSQFEPALFSHQDHRRLVEMQLEKKNGHHRYAVSIFYRAEWAMEEVWETVKRFAAVAPDNIFYWRTVMAWLKRRFPNQNEVVVEKIMEIQGWGIGNREIDQALLNALPHSEKAKAAKRLVEESKDYLVICNCLSILKNEPEGIEAAKRLVEESKDYLVIYTCLSILKNKPEGIEAAKRLVGESKDKEVICNCLSILKNKPEGIEAAKRLIGESKDKEVICNCLSILKNEPEGIEAAKRLIKESNDPTILSSCFIVLKNQPEGIEAAKRLIGKSKDHQVICNCLSILKNQPEGIEAANRLIGKSKDFQVICNCLSILKNQPEGIEAANRLIGKSKDFQVICTCLEILKDKPEGIEAAKRLIRESKVPEVICTSLEILKNEPEGLEAAKRLIVESKVPEVICTSLEILKNQQEGKNYASEVLKKWSTETVQIVSVALRTAPLENSQPVVEAVLAAPPNEHNQLRFSILYRNFMDIPAWQRRTRGILKNWRSCHRMLVGGTLQHYTSEEDFLLPICRSIIAAGGEEMQSAKKIAKKGKPPYVGHLVTAFAHPALRREAKRKAIELLLQESKAPGFLSSYFKEILEGIALRDEFPAWGASQETEE